MTARRGVRAVAIMLAYAAGIVATPVLGVLGLAAWQELAPGSLRAVTHEVAALTEADDARGVMDNLVAAIGPTARHPG